MKCSLIICTFNWHEALDFVLSSVCNQTTLPNEIIIADDGSDDNTFNVVNKYKQILSIPLIHSWQENIGCRIPMSRNRAIAKSNYEFIIMIDGDTVIHKDFVRDHLSIATRGVYTQGSRVLLTKTFTKKIFKDGEFKKPSLFNKSARNKMNMLRIPFLSRMISTHKSQNINRIRGCNYSIFKQDIIKVNGFNEEIVSWGREDSEFVQRLFNNGISKQQLKFSGLQYHLFHKQGEHNKLNENFLKNTIASKTLKCKFGIDAYLKEN